jgi:hypothetical protein
MERGTKIFEGKMTKVYILSGSYGSWDDYYRTNLGIFDSEEAANKAGKAFLKERKARLEKINSECPIDPEIAKRYEEEYDFELLESLSPEDQNLYHDWWFNKNKLKEINDNFSVDELELNKFDIDSILEENF